MLCGRSHVRITKFPLLLFSLFYTSESVHLYFILKYNFRITREEETNTITSGPTSIQNINYLLLRNLHCRKESWIFLSVLCQLA